MNDLTMSMFAKKEDLFKAQRDQLAIRLAVAESLMQEYLDNEDNHIVTRTTYIKFKQFLKEGD